MKTEHTEVLRIQKAKPGKTKARSSRPNTYEMVCMAAYATDSSFTPTHLSAAPVCLLNSIMKKQNVYTADKPQQECDLLHTSHIPSCLPPGLVLTFSLYVG